MKFSSEQRLDVVISTIYFVSFALTTTLKKTMGPGNCCFKCCQCFFFPTSCLLCAFGRSDYLCRALDCHVVGSVYFNSPRLHNYTQKFRIVHNTLITFPVRILSFSASIRLTDYILFCPREFAHLGCVRFPESVIAC